MFNSVRQATESFCYLFIKEPIVISRKGVDKTVLVRSARKSTFNYAEEQIQQEYPVISINYRYFKTPDVGGMSGNIVYDDAFASDPDLPDDLDTVKAFYEPIYLRFFFDVSVAAKTPEEYSAMQDWIVKKIMYKFQLALTKPDDVDQVPVYANYVCEPIEIPRTDGIFETNFDIQFDAWIYPLVPEDVPAITTIHIKADPVLPDEDTTWI